MLNKLFTFFFLVLCQQSLAQSNEDYPWKDISLIKVKSLVPFSTFGNSGEFFEAEVKGAEILAMPGLVTEKEYLEIFANENLAPQDYLKFRNEYFRKTLTLLTLSKMFEGEAFLNPNWHMLPAELGNYASLYTLLWYAEEILKMDLSQNIPSYESIYLRIKSEAKDGVRLKIDWKWCKYRTKVFCDVLSKKYPPFADQIIDIDVMPETWTEFNGVIVKRMQEFFFHERRRWTMEGLMNQEAQKYLNVSPLEKSKEKRMMHAKKLQDCNQNGGTGLTAEAKALCDLFKTEPFASEKIQTILEKFWTSKQESLAWSDVLKRISKNYGIFETLNLCGLSQTDSRYFCNEVSFQDILKLQKDSLFWLLSLGSRN